MTSRRLVLYLPPPADAALQQEAERRGEAVGFKVAKSEVARAILLEGLGLPSTGAEAVRGAEEAGEHGQ